MGKDPEKWGRNHDIDLKEYSESFQQKTFEMYKYTQLKLWSEYKLESNEDYKKYVQYEKSPISALNRAIRSISLISEVTSGNFANKSGRMKMQESTPSPI